MTVKADIKQALLFVFSLVRAVHSPYRIGRTQCSIFTGIGPEAESNHVTLRIKYGICPGISGIYPNPAAESNLGYIPLFWHATVAASRQGREFIMPPRRTGFNEYMPQGQRTLTEVDGVVEIGPVGPATQKEV